MRIHAKLFEVASTLAVMGLLAGCSESANKTVAQATSATQTAATAMQAGASLVSQLGGMSSVTQLANAFGANLAADPSLSKSLDAAAISQAKDGLVNDIAKASGMAPPHGTADLVSALSGKGLDSTGMSAVGTALSAAADSIHLDSAQKSGLMTLVTPMLGKVH